MDIYHESALKHVTGESAFIRDLVIPGQTLSGRVVYSTFAHAKLIRVDYEQALEMPGVRAILSHHDIPGSNQMGPVINDEPCLAVSTVECIGQAILLIAADDDEAAFQASRKIKIEYQPLPAILEIENAMNSGCLLTSQRELCKGDTTEGFLNADYIIEGQLKTGAQEHWYLETQSCLSIPGEDHEMTVHSSTQHPTETQAVVAEVLGIPRNKVIVEVRRMGGAFGGKETQANHVAAWTSLLARRTGKPVCISLFRDDDQIITGKRHRFLSKYKAGFTKEGKISAYEVELNGDGGYALDLSGAILDRAVFHADNAYFIPNVKVLGRMWKTNHPSNTAFRGFGAPQGMAVIEQVIDRMARQLGKDAAEIRKINLYRDNHNLTPFHQVVENNNLPVMFDQILETSDYERRRQEINEFNNTHEFRKKGMALTPVKFGISFTTSFLNQAAALVHIYQDGTIMLNHGGTEMGQGLHTKILGIASKEMGLAVEMFSIAPTNTSRVPNTSATAASSGSDLNGMAIADALNKLKIRLAKVIAGELSKADPNDPSLTDNISFQNAQLLDLKHPERNISFVKAVQLAYRKQTPLSATGYYATPGIYFDSSTKKGKPFHYFAFGMAVSEVELDILSGHFSVLRTDILHDVGNSLNINIDKGQIEGAFIQGLGWCTTECITWDKEGHLLQHSPDTYKIPTINDIPHDFRIGLFTGKANPNAIYGSKAVGEPPFMLAFSVWLAIKDAISANHNHEKEPEFELPATVATILKSL